MPTSRIGVCSWSLQPTGVDSLVDKLRGLPLNGIQLALGPLADEVAEWEGAVERLGEAGFEVISGMMAFAGEDYSTLESIARTGGVRPDETWMDNYVHAEAIAAVAARYDIGLVTFHAGFLPEDVADPERDRLIERVRDVADLFAASDIQLALETGQETADTLLQALHDIDRPNLGVNFDPANMILYGKGEPVAAMVALKPHVRQIHIKDAIPAETPDAWGTEVAAGTGAVDWPAFFEVATSIEPEVDYVIEREAGNERTNDIAAARELIGRYMR